MASMWGELKRRNVVKVAVAYAIVGWLLIEVSSVLLPAFEAPEWVLRVVILLVGLGFVLALILSWAYELTAQGVVRTDDVPASESATQVTGQKLNYLIIGALVLVLGFVVADNYVFDGAEQDAAVLEGATPETVAPVERPTGVLPNSVAVLPFENLSADPENAFFAAGIHEEVLNQLVKLSELNVIARTSMMQYAGGDKSIPQVARELNVETVMEGSVRYADGRVLVTAQLIDPITNAHLWSESYNREFADIFAIQADIATNIANALEAEFSLEEQASIEKVPTEFPAAYALYLKAISNFGLGRDTWRPDMEQALAIDPDFALAHAASAYMNAFYFGFESWTAEFEQSVLQSSERALSLDPTLGTAYVAIAYVHQVNWRLSEAKQSFERALELDPNDPQILNAYARFLRNVGEYRDSIRLGHRAVELDPNNNLLVYQQGLNLRYAREYDDAYNVLRHALVLEPAASHVHMQVAFTEIGRGNHEEALQELEIAEQLFTDDYLNRYRITQFAFGYSQLGRDEVVIQKLNMLSEIDRDDPVDDALWAMMYLALGDHEQALSHLERAIDEQDPNIFTLAELKANAYQMPVLDEPRFRNLLDQVGVLD